MDIMKYFNEAVAELSLVRWPTRKQAIRLSIIVLAFCAISAVIFGALDYILSEAIHFLLNSSL